MIRDDLSNKLTHLIRGDSMEEAFDKFDNILNEKTIRGGNGCIKGGYNCVCFTETPISKLGHVLTDGAKMRYKPFGIMVDKQYIFARGGRPAIYQPDDDFLRLPEELRYRHVRFDMESNPAIDFTWEREWRIWCNELPLDPEATTVILPQRKWREGLVANHTEYLRRFVASYGEDAAQGICPYPWHIIVLEDLGIPIPDGI
jgi:hypothetical protein